MIKNFILSLFLLSCISITAQEKTRFRKIDSLLTYLNNNNKFMGQLSIREGDNVVFSKAYGSKKYSFQALVKLGLLAASA